LGRREGIQRGYAFPGRRLILVPYTRLHPTTARLLNRHASGHVRVRLDPSDDTAYWALLAKAWREPGDLLIVEQDVGIRAGVIEELERCPEPWCGFPTAIGAQLLVCLGCTRLTFWTRWVRTRRVVCRRGCGSGWTCGFWIICGRAATGSTSICLLWRTIIGTRPDARPRSRWGWA
jgi:hypothetical protein